jgi:putative membrane protein
MAFLTDEDKAALNDAVAAVEALSSAEVVVIVRAQSGSYLHADLLAGIGFGLLVLWFQLFSPWEFSLESILIAAPILGAAVALLVSRAPAVRRRLTSAGRRARSVRTAALAEFIQNGIDATRGRTGVLVYVSLLERLGEVVADRGVTRAVTPAEWDARVGALKAAVAAGEPGKVVATHLRGLAALLAVALPRADDDVDELPNAVVA